MGRAHDIVLSPVTRTIIRAKAGQLCRRSDFTRSDYDDLCQSMSLHLLRKSHLYRPERGGLSGFVAVVLNRWVAEELRYRRRQRRVGERYKKSLSSRVGLGPDEGTAELGDELSLDARSGPPRSDWCRPQFHEAMSSVRGALRPEDEALLWMVATTSVAEAAREMGISRRTIDRRIDAIRQYFEQAGFSADDLRT